MYLQIPVVCARCGEVIEEVEYETEYDSMIEIGICSCYKNEVEKVKKERDK